MFLHEKQNAKRSCKSCNKFKNEVLYNFRRAYNRNGGSASTTNVKYMGKEEVSLKFKEMRRENLALKEKIRRQDKKLKVRINDPMNVILPILQNFIFFQEKEAELAELLERFDRVEEEVMEKLLEKLSDKVMY